MTTQQRVLFDCDICKDVEWIQVKDGFKPCECRERKMYQRILKNSGISEQYQRIGFKDYKDWNEQSKKAKETAIDYIKDFDNIKNTENNSILFLGQIGAGKTRLSIAIANNLMSKNIGVLYMPYRDIIVALKQNMIDEEYYQKEINKYKRASVLLVDDLYKGRITEADHNIMFEIINYRYLNMQPMIISSELTVDRLSDGEFEAVGSRLIHRGKGHIVEFIGRDLNYRLR